MKENISPKEGGRERLLEAASSLFSSRGLSGVSVAQVLELSRLKAPSLYHHFGDKEGLYVKWAETELARIGIQAASAAKHAPALREKLEAVAEAILSPPQVDLMQILKDLRSLHRDDSRKRIRAAYQNLIFNEIKSVFAEAMATGSLRRTSADQLTAAFIALTVSQQACYRFDENQSQPQAQWAVDVVLSEPKSVRSTSSRKTEV